VIELHNYLSDISREQFEIIRLDLEDAKKKNVRAHTTCTMFFVRSRRRILLTDFPSWQLVYYYLKVCTKPDENEIRLWDKIKKN